MVLAPQLRQSLEMLQVPILELRAMVQQEIEQNPTIEEAPNAVNPSVEIEPQREGIDDKKELEFDKEFEMLSRLDEEWRDYFYQNIQNRPYSRDQEDKHQFVLDSLTSEESLQEHLLAQLSLSGLPQEDQTVGELVIGSIDDDGYLTSDIEELATATATDTEHLRDILAVIQDFDPVGVASRDLRECILLQVERLEAPDSVATMIVRDYLEKLAGHKYQEIARALGVSVEEVQEAAKTIATLNPKPGSAYNNETATYILPEIVVQKVNGEYVVILNDDQLPHVRISRHYRQLLASENTKPEVKSYIRERIRSGAFLIKSIHQRQKTIHRIASEIVASQQAFLENGIKDLRPMTMAEVARKVEVHETTVSRAVSGKYMRTPSGIFELKYFFTPGIKTDSGKDVSNKTVKDMIARMVADEDTDNPLSDQEIMKRLKEQGIKIARRTIAKYRLVLRIPPSHMRKRF